MSDDQTRLDSGQVDTSTPDQTPDVSLDNAVSIREAAFTRSNSVGSTASPWPTLSVP